MSLIQFNKPPFTGDEEKYVLKAMKSKKLSGDGVFGKKCQRWFEENFTCKKTLLTPSCTAALEMAALLLDIQPYDEVIMPSYTFVSTANAFVLRGARIVFVDVCPDTMNIDETKIEAAITEKTRAIVPVHYAGVACEMDFIMELADKYGLFVIEDAAQGVMAEYKGKALGTIGHLGTYSFHETKNYTSGGEGGLLLINDERFMERAEIIREKGTNRSLFFRGMVDKYSWVDLGSSYLPSELQSAYLYAQLQKADQINDERLRLWHHYYNSFTSYDSNGKIELPYIPSSAKHNAHMFYIKLRDIDTREKLMYHLKEKGIDSVFHYVPLHNSIAGKGFSIFFGNDEYTTRESERILRLPLWYGLLEKKIDFIVKEVIACLSCQ